ncbi:amidohydrolase family protein [Fusibacter paucivorans]|uniref:Amidohydrolase family protein n=1 Tax=Fusibacter paucivorans TaxID=76009 RepID=A0ABS5PU68_9FIRM|nr:amidohydrolase family protein [Fusibacter paucivorans]MBS7527944.1 amidohydrolase family protein [Fusibacter paucivorans]
MAAIEIRNVKIFDGIKITDQERVVIEHGVISAKKVGDRIVHGNGGTLLPGLIDSHVHLYEQKNLEDMTRYGITTALDMGTRSPDIIDHLRNLPGLTDIRSCYSPAFAKDSELSEKMGFTVTSNVTSPIDAERFVKEQVAHGADYIKVILEEQSVNGGGAPFPPKVLSAVVEKAHQYGKRVITHVIAPKTYQEAIETGVDVLTHTPFAIGLPRPLIEKLSAKKMVAIPTMYMMKGIVETIKQKNPLIPFDYNYVRETVATMHTCGVTLIAGTDSNINDPTTPFSAPYGISLLDELCLMVDAGLTPIEALQSATSIPADYWGLNDRGVIKAGNRADLLLVNGDPTTDIHAIKHTRRVWILGKETELR